MDNYSLNVNSPIKGGYFSSEQIDLLSIIQCQSIDELMRFIANCDQINRVNGIFESINGMDLESAKRSIFKSYQNSMVYHDQGLDASRMNRFNYLGITSEEELMSVIDKSHPRSQEILSLNHHFISEEWDQTKSISYEEMETLNSQLPLFNSMLIGSGKIYKVINKYDTNKDTKYDFYFAKRDLDFAYKNGKQVRFHSLLVKDDGKIFNEKSKEEIIDIIKEYVKQSIDFINGYNSSHKININGKEEPVINAVDLFNEIVSFDKNEQGEYYNIWEQKYGISMPELMSCFEYALVNKPEGVNYLYNEPFLEDDQRRQKVFETLSQTTPGLIDTLGSQMHITITQDIDSIRRCFADFKKLQESTGKNIQITEFDMCLGRNDVPRVFGPNADISLERVYQQKEKNISEISSAINESGVKLSGVSYWSLTDGIDCNLERIRSNALSNHQISNVNEIPTVCGGLIPTHKKLVRNNELNQMVSNSNQSNMQSGIHI
ncbi:MAG: endo-1,4-beta-xylanase [Bacilli bacterium]|nr:endo-1,4-beta-xylanase [Bacilli bacterium]